MNKQDLNNIDPRWSPQRIGEILKALRMQANLTQDQLGKEVGKSQQTVGHWEKGNNYPTLDVFFVLCDLYKIDISTVFMKQSQTELTVAKEESALIEQYRAASEDDKELILHILGRHKKNHMEEFSKEIAI